MKKNFELSIPDIIFPTNNDAEIPTLRLDLQAQYCEIPFLAYGEQKRTFDMEGSGTLHFYVDDYRFASLYEQPSKILKHNPASIVEPNFSMFNEMPIAFALQAIYKKRWIARCMQEQGLRVFVDLNVAQKFYKLNMLGVPMGWSAFATRGYSDRLSNLEFEYMLAKEWADGNPLLFVIYGGGLECKRFAHKNNCVYINPCVTTKKKLEAMKQIHEGTAFLGEEFAIKGLEGMTHYSMQLEDFSKSKLLTDSLKSLNETKELPEKS